MIPDIIVNMNNSNTFLFMYELSDAAVILKNKEARHPHCVQPIENPDNNGFEEYMPSLYKEKHIKKHKIPIIIIMYKMIFI